MLQDNDLLTYLTGEPGPEVALPRVGDAVELRLAVGGKVLEAFSAAGQKLGRVSPVERNALAESHPAGLAGLRGRITALVPRPLLAGAGRIHILVPAG